MPYAVNTSTIERIAGSGFAFPTWVKTHFPGVKIHYDIEDDAFVMDVSDRRGHEIMQCLRQLKEWEGDKNGSKHDPGH